MEMKNSSSVLMQVKENCLEIQGAGFMNDMSLIIKTHRGHLIITEGSEESIMPHAKGCINDGRITDKNCVEFVRMIYPEGSTIPLVCSLTYRSNGEPLNTYYVVGIVPV